jgi:hypothetical protein
MHRYRYNVLPTGHSRWATTAVLALLCAVPAAAQQAPATMTVEQAVQLARRHSPAFLMQAKD